MARLFDLLGALLLAPVSYVLVFALIGSCLIVIGVYLVFGLGSALIVAGAFLILAARLIAQGMKANG